MQWKRLRKEIILIILNHPDMHQKICHPSQELKFHLPDFQCPTEHHRQALLLMRAWNHLLMPCLGILCLMLPCIEINIRHCQLEILVILRIFEFMDPAILAVGKGRLPGGRNNAASLDMRSDFSSQLSAFENEARLQLLVQRSLSPLQNQRYADMGVGFAQLNDAYRIPSRIMEQSLPNNLSPFSQLALQQPRTALMSNGQWDAWNEVQSGNDMGMRNKQINQCVLQQTQEHSAGSYTWMFIIDGAWKSSHTCAGIAWIMRVKI
ncbi:hypothetical protein LOK49_LG08G00961 [Camellia lanceoleosa]|uniref:Uncharacterized protein n=1 Tax=Camellia lanceoleosa TaxID=1840588 RepID=A0ACC0GSG1_9ERIC|nr:hypothetical protein LOK49_LG08G00961 [Camellia lanceoleosa]